MQSFLVSQHRHGFQKFMEIKLKDKFILVKKKQIFENHAYEWISTNSRKIHIYKNNFCMDFKNVSTKDLPFCSIFHKLWKDLCHVYAQPPTIEDTQLARVRGRGWWEEEGFRDKYDIQKSLPWGPSCQTQKTQHKRQELG